MRRFASGLRSAKRRMSGSPDFSSFDAQYKEGDFRRAVFTAQDLVALYPRSKHAKYKLALALSRNGQLLRSREILRGLGEENPDDPRYARALEVVGLKIVTAEQWVNDRLDKPSPAGRSPESKGLVRKSPQWLQVQHLDSRRAPHSPDQLRRGAELLMSMHSWKESADRYRELMRTGKAAQRDLKNRASCLFRAGRLDELDSLLIELNNMRRREKQNPYTLTELAAATGHPDRAVEDIQFSSIEALTSEQELSKIQLRFREAGRISDALEIGRILVAVQDSAKYALRNGLYAEQLERYDEAAAEFARAVQESPGVPSVALLHLARLVGKEEAEGSEIRGLIIAHAYWREFDTDGTALAGLLEAIGQSGDSSEAQGLGRGGVIESSTSSFTDAELATEDTAAADLVAADAFRERQRRWRAPGANANRALRRRAALKLLSAGSYQLAVNEALKIVFSATKFDAKDHAFLGYVLLSAGRHRQAFNALCAAEEVPSAHRYQAPGATVRTRQVFRYIELCKLAPVVRNVFVWESHFGNRVDCNPYAMYRELRSREGRSEDLHIWVSNNPDVVPNDVLDDPQTVVTPRESWGYWDAMTLAQYLTNNASFPFEFVKREDQVHANTWHGTPLKALGRDDHDSPYDYGNVSRNLLHASQMLMPSQFTANVLSERYCVEALSSAKISVVGQARNDILVNMSDTERRQIRRMIGLGPEDTFVLYAPTWRGGSKSSWFDTERLVADLQLLGASDDFVLGFRGHPLALQHLKGLSVDALIPEPNITTYELLAVADVLITDYSSLGIDFLCRVRPVIYYMYDYDEYSATRGLYFAKEEFPGVVASTPDELVDAVNEAVAGSLLSTQELESFREKFAPLDDGGAAERANNALTSDSRARTGQPRDTESEHMPILMVHGLENRDSLEAFVRTANHLAASGQQVVVAFNHSAVVADPALVEVLDTLLPSVSVLPRKGRIFERVDEYASNATFMRRDDFVGDMSRSNYESTIRREAHRLFGSAVFSTAISWGADTALWLALCGMGVVAKRRIVYIDTNFALSAKFLTPWQSRARHLLGAFDQVIVSDLRTKLYLESDLGIERSEFMDRRDVGIPAPDAISTVFPQGSIALIASDASFSLLKEVVIRLDSWRAAPSPVSWVVFVHGAAREEVAELVRAELPQPVSAVRTDVFPGGGSSDLAVLVDISDTAVPSIASLDAHREGVPVVWAGDLQGGDSIAEMADVIIGRVADVLGALQVDGRPLASRRAPDQGVMRLPLGLH